MGTWVVLQKLRDDKYIRQTHPYIIKSMEKLYK